VGAMECCHKQGIIHRDLKLENVLFESKARCRIKVVDFGIAGMVKGGRGEENNAATLRYMTPEMVASYMSTASPAMDIWAIGVMLYSMIFLKFPFGGKDRQAIKDAILNKEAKIPKDFPCTSELIDFLNGCLQKDPAKRITIL